MFFAKCFLIDCMPSLGMVTINALSAADSVIIPVAELRHILSEVRLSTDTVSQHIKKDGCSFE